MKKPAQQADAAISPRPRKWIRRHNHVLAAASAMEAINTAASPAVADKHRKSSTICGLPPTISPFQPSVMPQRRSSQRFELASEWMSSSASIDSGISHQAGDDGRQQIVFHRSALTPSTLCKNGMSVRLCRRYHLTFFWCSSAPQKSRVLFCQ